MNSSLQAHYGAMWERAFPSIAAGDIECDARLAAGPDPRRGLTVIARPGPALAARFDALLDRLDLAAPGQYRHPAADMHLTVLSLFTVSEDASFALVRLDDYRAAVQEAVRGIDSFEIEFLGITLSRGAVMACGYPRDGMLETLRERLRAQLRERGLDGTLDGRYRLVTAHSTLLRFAVPLADPLRFARELESLRDEPLGTMRVDEVKLVVNDWYMSSGSLQLVDSLRLK
jgi:2'-5' RNA ligase